MVGSRWLAVGGFLAGGAEGLTTETQRTQRVIYCYFLLDFGGMLVCELGDVVRGRWSLVAVDWGLGFSQGARRG